MKKRGERGFTLIELVMVIILLGILAAVAIPTFVDLGGSADDAAQDGVLGGLRSGISIYYASTALGGSASYPPGPFNAVSQPSATSTETPASGAWGFVSDGSTGGTIYYKRKSDGVTTEWTYVSATGFIS